jgi:hypothetical protein
MDRNCRVYIGRKEDQKQGRFCDGLAFIVYRPSAQAGLVLSGEAVRRRRERHPHRSAVRARAPPSAPAQPLGSGR